MRSCPTLRSSPGLASPSPFSREPKRSTRSFGVVRSPLKAAQSTTVTHVSRRATSSRVFAPRRALAASDTPLRSPSLPNFDFLPSALPSFTVNISATCSGSLTPELSTTMASNFRSFASSAIALTRSVRSVQQMQPFCSSTSVSLFASVRVPRTRFASTLIAATSFTTTATFLSPASSRMRFSKVVLPAPRKPDSKDTGTGRIGAEASTVYFHHGRLRLR
mmetsp:Transcript_4468/g.11063  ORF Transcript_4468/g.11063 Transcript_4468/m.11063 type:complete len:220 (+) Transcript_4468:669-1328(+)